MLMMIGSIRTKTDRRNFILLVSDDNPPAAVVELFPARCETLVPKCWTRDVDFDDAFQVLQP